MIASFIYHLPTMTFTTPDFIGVRNYIEMFTQDGRFIVIVGNLRFVFLSVPLQLAFALILALMLNKGIFRLAGFRAIYYIRPTWKYCHGHSLAASFRRTGPSIKHWPILG